MKKSEVLKSLNLRVYFSGEVPSITWNGDSQGIGLCPFHDDQNKSLSVNASEGVFYCHGCGEKGTVFDFHMKRHGLTFKEAINDLGNMAGLDKEEYRKIVQTYDYTDEQGKPLFQVVRFDPKGFAQRRLDSNGEWVWNLKGVRLVPYRLHDLSSAKSVVVVEGEKDVEALKRLGLTVTCNPMGAGKWRDDFTAYFSGKKIVVIPDNDETGRKHAQAVARSLSSVAEWVKIIELPGLPLKGDVSDWMHAGGTKEEIVRIIKEAPLWKAEGPAERKAPKMKLTKLSDLFDEPEESVEWAVENMLPAGGFSVIAAKPKVGKSTLTRHLALCVARGDPFLGREVMQGPVILYSLEEKRSEVKRHFKDMGARGDEELYMYAGSAPLDALNEVRQKVEEIKPALVVIDPLFRLTRVRDGNDYAQVTQALEPLLMLARETGTHVLCVHHTSKGDRQGGDSVLGSQAIFGSVDTLMLMKRHEHCRTIMTQQRYGDDLEETTLDFDPIARSFSMGSTKENADIETIKEAVYEYLSEKGESVTEAEVLHDVEGRRAHKVKVLRELVNEGRAKRDGRGGKGDPFKYSCSLVPTCIQGTRIQESGNGFKVNNDGMFSCSGAFLESNKTREQESEWGNLKDIIL